MSTQNYVKCHKFLDFITFLKFCLVVIFLTLLIFEIIGYILTRIS